MRNVSDKFVENQNTRFMFNNFFFFFPETLALYETAWKNNVKTGDR